VWVLRLLVAVKFLQRKGMFVLQLKEQGATVTFKAYYPSKTLSEHFEEIGRKEGQNMRDGLKEFYIMKFMPGLFHWLLQTAIDRYPTWVFDELPSIPEKITHIETNKGIKVLCLNKQKLLMTCH
jgi:hypothetical protein